MWQRSRVPRDDERSTLFRRARVAVLLSILVVVIAYAVTDVRSRRARTEWRRTLEVAIVVVRAAPIDEGAVPALVERAVALDAALDAEMRRYRQGGPAPFHFTVLGPIDGAPPPRADADGLWAAITHSLALTMWTRDVDARASVNRRAFDARIYVSARPRASRTRVSVEGDSEPGGRVGTVSVDLDATSADYALAVVAHEALHTLGATDKYGSDGRVVEPGGLAEPDAVPRYPQSKYEVMTRGRLVAPGVERAPGDLDELGVGPATAAEIRWTP
jgi:hypothetical protein